mmetsp:Transcript_68998/g.191073  ORF Transcript_68998/g.191073 Transcript_68998/m.191073 type:complete len:145 (+) Transcript_68998:243-677(+)
MSGLDGDRCLLSIATPSQSKKPLFAKIRAIESHRSNGWVYCYTLLKKLQIRRAVNHSFHLRQTRRFHQWVGDEVAKVKSIQCNHCIAFGRCIEHKLLVRDDPPHIQVAFVNCRLDHSASKPKTALPSSPLYSYWSHLALQENFG